MLHDRDDSGLPFVLEGRPNAQSTTDPYPELPLGVEAFRSPLHSIPATPQVREDPSANVAYIVVSILAVALGVFAVFAMQESGHEIVEARGDLERTSDERKLSAAAIHVAGLVGTAPAIAASTPRKLVSTPTELATEVRTPAKKLSSAEPIARAERRAKRRGPARSTAARARAKPAVRAVPELPARNAVLAAMRSVTREARSCLSGDAVAQVDIKIRGETGTVGAATVRGVTGAAASCVARAVRQAKLQPFAKPELEITFPFRAR